MSTVSNFSEYAEQAIENFVRRTNEEKSLLVDAVRDRRVERLLDVGCAGGHEILPFLERTEAFCVGVDNAAELGPVSRKFFKTVEFENRFAFVRSAGESLPFAADSFDVVLCRVALPYMENRRALAEIARVLRPGGVFLLKTHAPAFYFGMIRERLKTLNPKQLAYPLICLGGGLFHTLTGKQPRGGFWNGKEIFQTRGFIERECARNGLSIEGFLPDTNPGTPSFVITKN